MIASHAAPHYDHTQQHGNHTLHHTVHLYTHHDIPLPVFPLSLAWMDYRPHASLGAADAADARRSNMLAVGTFAPYIEARLAWRRRAGPSG